MQHQLQSSHDFAPHTLRFNGRIKEGSLQTKDQIRWVRDRIDVTLSTLTKRIRFDAELAHRLKTVAN